MSTRIARRPAELTEWEYFVVRHQLTGNLLFHLASWLMWFVTLAGSILTWKWQWIAAFVVSPWVGVAGHYLYKDGLVRSRDFVRPQTVIFLTAIFFLILTGRYGKESQRVLDRVRKTGNGELIHSSL